VIVAAGLMMKLPAVFDFIRVIEKRNSAVERIPAYDAALRLPR